MQQRIEENNKEVCVRDEPSSALPEIVAMQHRISLKRTGSLARDLSAYRTNRTQQRHAAPVAIQIAKIKRHVLLQKCAAHTSNATLRTRSTQLAKTPRPFTSNAFPSLTGLSIRGKS